jgi:hypoxanthine phosphoribosyltransferase
MDQIQILDKVFRKDIGYDRIHDAVTRLSAEIMADYGHLRPLFLCVLNGSFMFAGDLLKEYNGACEVSFIKLSSYRGTNSTEEVRTLIGLSEDIRGRDVVILEDIIDTGITISQLLKDLTDYAPNSIRVATLLLKPDALRSDIRPDYVGLEIPNDFIVGYGLDYDGYGRNSRDIYRIIDK